MNPPTTPRPLSRRHLVVATFGLVAVTVLGGCAHGNDATACRDENNRIRAEDSRCQNDQAGFDWVDIHTGDHVPAVGEPIPSATRLPPQDPGSTSELGGFDPRGGTAGDEGSGSGARSGSGRGGYAPVEPVEPEEDDDE
jgi:hypothetical protein